MSNIVHTRIDYRLIHGQVITKWLKVSNANVIIIIDDALSKDAFMASIYTMAAPAGVEVKVVSIEEASSEWQKGEFYKDRVLLLFKSIDTALECVEKGLRLDYIQVGGLENKPGRKLVFNQITMDVPDLEKLKKIAEKDIRIYFQTIPEEEPADLAKIEKKLL